MKSPTQLALDITEFLSTCAEWHALVIGFCEVLCPWPPHLKIPKSKSQTSNSLEFGACHLEFIFREYHYYMFGRALGVLAWLAIAKLIQETFF